jgi:peptide/nickel transport system ATP-binding protein
MRFRTAVPIPFLTLQRTPAVVWREHASCRLLFDAGKPRNAASQPRCSDERCIVTTPLLEAEEVSKEFTVGRRLGPGGRRQVHAVDRVSLQVWPGETLGLVGESGCGKSTLGRCLVRLYNVTSGRIRFEGKDITELGPSALRPIRRRLQMVFQDPYASLNPRRRVADIIAEPLRVHFSMSAADVTKRVQELLTLVGLSPDHLSRFPHEFSGGQRQRIGVARALALEPRVIVADEPVSALDVSIQAQIINLFADLQERLGLTYIIIAHDLSVIRQVSNRTAVMYLGSIVETGPTELIYNAPAHPYTQALISAVPVPEMDSKTRRERIVLTGDVPSPMNPPTGCRFNPRCRFATELCRRERPPLLPLGDGREVACHYPLVASAVALTGEITANRSTSVSA